MALNLYDMSSGFSKEDINLFLIFTYFTMRDISSCSVQMLRQPLFLLSLASFVAQLSCLLSPCSAPPPPPLPPRLPLSDPLQTCLFGATIYLGAYCCSHQVIGAVARTSTWDMGGRKSVCVCLSVGACRAKGRQRKQRAAAKTTKKKKERKKERDRGNDTHWQHEHLRMSRLPRVCQRAFHTKCSIEERDVKWKEAGCATQ